MGRKHNTHHDRSPSRYPERLEARSYSTKRPPHMTVFHDLGTREIPHISGWVKANIH